MKNLILFGVLAAFLAVATVSAQEEEKKDTDEVQSICPVTKITGQEECLKCHVIGNFKVKETRTDDLYVYPNVFTKILHNGEERVGIFSLDGEIESIRADHMREFFDYMTKQDINRVIVDIHSPGGSLFSGLKMVGIMHEWETSKPGRIVGTRCNGFAASAAFITFVSGTKGHREASPNAELMYHQILTFSMLKISTPASSEEEARVLKHLQTNIDEYIASRGNLNKDEIDDRVRNKEFWITGKEAVKFGFADKLLGSK